jgi:predicted HNH restriction endonuclease
MSKPLVTDDLKNQLLSQIAHADGIATTEDLLPFVRGWKEREWSERHWSDIVRWALIGMANAGFLARPFGNVEGGQSQNRQVWFRYNRPRQNTEQQVWEITELGKKHLAEVQAHLVTIPEEVQGLENEDIIEGATKTIVVNSYERNPEARRKCIKHHGHTCAVCGFDFGEVYGEIGNDYIHVHHIKPLSKIKKRYKVNPTKDLVPVCPNCHAMLHKRHPPFSIADLRKIVHTKKLNSGQ